MGEKKRGQKVNWGGYAKGRSQGGGGISSMHAKKATNGHSNRHRQTQIDRHTDKHTKKGEGRGIKEINAKLLKDTKLGGNASPQGS